MGAPHPDKVIALFKNLKLIHLSAKLQQTNPLLVASVTGSIRKVKIRNDEDATRKGFGGANRSLSIDLTAAIVQTVSRIVKNCHPASLTIMACMNSIFLWTCCVSGHVFHLSNALGDSYR